MRKEIARSKEKSGGGGGERAIENLFVFFNFYPPLQLTSLSPFPNYTTITTTITTTNNKT